MDDMLLQLKETVDMEVAYMKSLMEVMGTLDTLFAIANRNESTNQNAQKTVSAELTPSATAESL